jgi:hypothetical protein
MTRIIGIKGKVLAVLALKRVPIPLESLVFADSSEKVLVLALFLNKYFIKLFLKSPIVEFTISKKSTLIIMLLKIHNK